MDVTIESGVSLITLWGMRILVAALILIAGWVIGNFASDRIKKFQRLDETLKSFLGGFAKYAIFVLAIVTVLGQFGVQTASLIALIGAAGLAIGLALQGTLSNVAAGVMMLILRPLNVGDYVEAAGVGGTVKSLGLFGTELATPDNVFIFVPNSQVWGSTISNYSRNTTRRQDFVMGISYSDDINKAMKSLQKVVDKETRLLDSDGKKPEIMVSNLGASSVDITVRVWMKASDYWAVKWDLTKAMKEALDKDGLTIPFPTVQIAGDEQDNTPAAKSKAAAAKAA